MRIVFVSTGSPRDMGTNYRVLGLARHAKELGLEVHVLLPGRPENLQWLPEGHYCGVPIHFTACGALEEMREKYKLLCSLRPDFVHCVDVVGRCFLPSVAYRLSHRCQLIVDIDEHLSRIMMFGFTERMYFRICENLAKRYADRLVVASRFLESWFGQPPRQPILYLPNAVDLDFFEQQRLGWEELKLKWGGRKVAMYFGNLSSHYDADMVFEAALILLRRRKDLVFVFVGGGEMLGTLRGKAIEAGLEESIQFCGFVPDEAVPKYLSAADALVFPIRDNWWNRARCPGKVYYFTAAMAPIVTNPVGEVREALGNRAWYFRDGDTDDFLRVLEQCLAAGRDARCPDQTMANLHCWRKRAQSYLRFLETAA